MSIFNSGYLDPWQDVQSIADLYQENSCEEDLLDGPLNRQETFRYADGSVYKGYFLNGQCHGWGLITYPDGGSYEGEFDHGKFHGRGTLTYADGIVYQGEFDHGRRNGRGFLTYLDGGSYEGEFDQGTFHGRGTLTDADGTVYEGEFRHGRRHGKGTLSYANGEIYQGEFYHGKRHGKGVITRATGIVREAHFFHGARIDSNQSELGDASFVNLLFGGQEGDVRGYALGIIADYLSCHPKAEYRALAKSLLEAHRLYGEESHAASQRIYEALQEGRSCLLPYGYDGHEIGLNLTLSEGGEFVCCEIFNSGDGLDRYHLKHPQQGKYQTVFRVSVPFSELTPCKIEELLSYPAFKDVHESYHQISGMPGAQFFESFLEKPVWQAAQKGENCTAEWIFAYLKNNMGEQEYKELRRELFLACLESAGTITKHLPFDERVPPNLVPNIRAKLLKLQLSPEEKELIAAHGHWTGVQRWKNGDVYEGDCLYGMPDGKGCEKKANGDVYTGDFCNGEYHGNGTYQYKNGDIYEGAFFNGMPHGSGVERQPNGAVYEGEFYEGKFHGYGIYRYPNGDVYEGMFADGAPHGPGVETRVSGDVYEGDFFQGEPCGDGIKTYVTKDVYMGQVFKGEPHGWGVGIQTDGEISEGTFCKGDFCARGEPKDFWEEEASDQ